VAQIKGVVAQLRRCGGSVTVVWWLSYGGMGAQLLEVWWLSYWRCGGSVIGGVVVQLFEK
jgi:hypothetical protein